MGINHVTVGGNLTRDPELRYTKDGTPVCGFGLAVNDNYTNKAGEKKDSVTFLNVSAWRRQAENCAEYLHKGDMVLAMGRLKQSSWEDKNGNKRDKIEVVAQQVHFLKTKGSSGQGRIAADEGEPGLQDTQAQGEPEEDEEIPF